MIFDKSAARFPIQEEYTYLAHCGISPLYPEAARAAIHVLQQQQSRGAAALIEVYESSLAELKEQAALLLRTQPENMAFVRNTSEAISMIANGYPFEPGDEVITFMQEYPANYHPWRLQERRGVRVKLLSNVPARADVPDSIIGRWSEDELLELITPRTRVVALSHVQFTSGYAADLPRLARICREHNIDLVIDAAQSLGSMPLYPDEWQVAAVASAGWKWLMGPMGTGLFYTQPAFRDKLELTMVGAETMEQEFDFLNLDWAPQTTARRFEFSTAPIALVPGLTTCLREIHNIYGADQIYQEIIRLQDHLLSRLDDSTYQPLLFEPAHRSGILSIYCPEAEAVVERLAAQRVICTARGGVLRVAPHFYNTEADMERLADLLQEG